MPTVEFPGAIGVWAHPVNYWTPQGHGGVPNQPRALVLHTPEEKADAIEVTPYYFARENFNEDGSRRLASTHYYDDSDGDLFQMVPEGCAAIANGLDGKPLPSWALPSTSLNWQTLSIEIEGYAATIHETCERGRPQWNTLVQWVRRLTAKYNIPLDREHIIGHYQVSTSRTDPGKLDILALIADAKGDDDMGMTPIEQKQFHDLKMAVLALARKDGHHDDIDVVHTTAIQDLQRRQGQDEIVVPVVASDLDERIDALEAEDEG